MENNSGDVKNEILESDTDTFADSIPNVDHSINMANLDAVIANVVLRRNDMHALFVRGSKLIKMRLPHLAGLKETAPDKHLKLAYMLAKDEHNMTCLRYIRDMRGQTSSFSCTACNLHDVPGSHARHIRSPIHMYHLDKDRYDRYFITAQASDNLLVCRICNIPVKLYNGLLHLKLHNIC